MAKNYICMNVNIKYWFIFVKNNPIIEKKFSSVAADGYDGQFFQVPSKCLAKRND